MKSLTSLITSAFVTLAATTLLAQTPAPVASVPTPVKKTSVIHQRKENQQKRIANGVASGSLTPKETAKLETKEAKLNNKIATQRAANGGTLTAAQKHKVAVKQDAISKDINKQKHDAQVQK